ncbi:MAG: hypothetical protein B6I24_06635 [Bacteroidetes bacterium 4572_128]|nr:MAG: hypothetical protein B6I24_06635 [Bacteroidetes bacterium 4572_128]
MNWIWSRRINSKDRLIYEIKENEIIIISCLDIIYNKFFF